MTDTDQIKKRYNRAAKWYGRMKKPKDSPMSVAWSKALNQYVYGKVLEVGVGTGNNLINYPVNVDLTAIDFSKNMLENAKAKYQKDSHNITFLEMDVEDMNFEDDTFDTVVTSCVFCSVPDPVKGLREIRRVLKNNGLLLMLEHVRSSNRIVGKLMDWLNPIPLKLYGANINRNTYENLKKAGFTDIAVTNLRKDIFKFFKVRNIK